MSIYICFCFSYLNINARKGVKHRRWDFQGPEQRSQLKSESQEILTKTK